MRLFTALDPGSEARQALVRIQDSFRRQGVTGNYSRPENLHMTLVFLGECSEKQKEKVLRILEDLPVPDVTLHSRKLTHFGRMWVLEFERDPQLADWIKTFRDQLRLQDIPFDDKVWRPHITLIRKPDRDPEGPVPEISFEAEKAVLYLSTQPKGRLTYTALNAGTEQED